MKDKEDNLESVVMSYVQSTTHEDDLSHHHLSPCCCHFHLFHRMPIIKRFDVCVSLNMGAFADGEVSTPHNNQEVVVVFPSYYLGRFCYFGTCYLLHKNILQSM